MIKFSTKSGTLKAEPKPVKKPDKKSKGKGRKRII